MVSHAARRVVPLEDLLTFRLGFGAILAPPGTYPIQAAEAEVGLRTLGPPWPPRHFVDFWEAACGALAG
jgi:hypothetical protein